jgi:hypothetical protein
MSDKEANQSMAAEHQTVTFKCKFCGEVKPLKEMVRITRFFPLIVACADCEKKMDRTGTRDVPEVSNEEEKISEQLTCE